jgi:hypothetical protein
MSDLSAMLKSLQEGVETNATHQDPLKKSKRVGSAALGVVSAGVAAALADPSTHAAVTGLLGATLGPWAPVITMVASAALAAWSKTSDQRPVKGR